MIQEINKRRTMAIISHPDAGKTTLTEKFLLYGGALHLAGTVKARKNQRSATSDWMELEKKRGISISSTVLQFDYEGYKLNLLDTPGHKDFSEDTYRVLTAVDSVIMVIDAAKGIEAQTRKLFEICRRRGIPIFTFMNKMDRPCKDPLTLCDELEEVLQLNVYPVNWPLGQGMDFKGVYDRLTNEVHLFDRREGGGSQKAGVQVGGIKDEFIRGQLPEDIYDQFVDEVDLLDGAGEDLDIDDVMRGGTTPVFFGSALNNFGVQLLLDSFLKFPVLPLARRSGDNIVPTDHNKFSAFIFKIMANMDPKHRDRIAFLRVCSGKFERDMVVRHQRTGDSIRLSNARKMFGQERESVDEAYAGDIVGIVGRSGFGIGDTLTNDPDIVYREIPRFTPECFMFMRNPNPSDFKKFNKGMDQLLEEGVVQEFLRDDTMHQNVRLLAAVGPLQFEVVKYRLETEYGAESILEPAPWTVLRWLSPETTEKQLQDTRVPSGCSLATDVLGHHVLLLPSEWTMNYFKEKNPDIIISDIPFDIT
ncbi:MAG: peptide chain release factor 3 [Spartobacteria bacterium]|nr:peptide chain release factor 3 [Spartobacteria bacterium]